MLFELDRLLFIYLVSSEFPKLLKHRRHVGVDFGLSPYVSLTTWCMHLKVFLLKNCSRLKVFLKSFRVFSSLSI